MNKAAKPIHLSDVDTRKFWSHVSLPDADGCMLWVNRSIASTDYARFELGSGKRYWAHRVSCFLAHGEAPSPYYEAAHSCRNRRCVAPDHLRWATRADNQLDRVRDGTHNRGERQGQSKLTVEQVLEIRRRRGEVHRALAEEFGVCRQAISDILSGRNWSHLDEAG